jgi:hypothetical protein
MDLVKWIKQKKRRDDNDVDDDDVRREGRQYRSRSVDPTSAHYIAAQNINLAHHGGDDFINILRTAFCDAYSLVFVVFGGWSNREFHGFGLAKFAYVWF